MFGAVPSSRPDCSTADYETAYDTRMRVEKLSPTVFTQLDDGTGVLLNLETLVYYSLNRTAVSIWQRIENEPSVPIEALVQVTCDRFNVLDHGVVRREIEGFVGRLQLLRLVRLNHEPADSLRPG